MALTLPFELFASLPTTAQLHYVGLRGQWRGQRLLGGKRVSLYHLCGGQHSDFYVEVTGGRIDNGHARILRTFKAVEPLQDYTCCVQLAAL